MADMSWMSALWASGGGSGSGGTSNYNELANQPVTNVIGTGVVISALSTGVYNIDGSWKMTEDDIERTSYNDDLFYVLNDGAMVKLTRISAGEIQTMNVPVGGTAADIVTDEVATAEEVMNQLVAEF